MAAENPLGAAPNLDASRRVGGVRAMRARKLLTGGHRSGVIVRLDFFAAENIALTVEHVSGVAGQNDPPDLLPWVRRRIQKWYNFRFNMANSDDRHRASR
jgi:hypothetical protein